jgi:hypothetical protein
MTVNIHFIIQTNQKDAVLFFEGQGLAHIHLLDEGRQQIGGLLDAAWTAVECRKSELRVRDDEEDAGTKWRESEGWRTYNFASVDIRLVGDALPLEPGRTLMGWCKCAANTHYACLAIISDSLLFIKQNTVFL